MRKLGAEVGERCGNLQCSAVMYRLMEKKALLFTSSSSTEYYSCEWGRDNVRETTTGKSFSSVVLTS